MAKHHWFFSLFACLNIAETALTFDPRYGNLEFLKENLWGDILLSDAKSFLETCPIQSLLRRLPIPDPEF
jgi:hypothetical protein